MYLYSPSTLGFYIKELHKETVPEDAIEITTAEYEDCLHAISKGHQLSVSNGSVRIEKNASRSLDELIGNYLIHVDKEAGNARQRFVSSGQLIEEEYREALQSVKEWRLEGSPEENVPEEILVWAEATFEGDVEQAAQSIENTARDWKEALSSIRKLRLEGKLVISKVTDISELEPLAEEYLTKLKNIKPS